MITDSLTFVGESLFGQRASTAELIACMDELGIDRAVVCPLKPVGYRLEAANDAVAEAVQAHPARLDGFARVHPSLGAAAGAALERDRGRTTRPLRIPGRAFCVSAPIVDPSWQPRSSQPADDRCQWLPWLSEGFRS